MGSPFGPRQRSKRHTQGRFWPKSGQNRWNLGFFWSPNFPDLPKPASSDWARGGPWKFGPNFGPNFLISWNLGPLGPKFTKTSDLVSSKAQKCQFLGFGQKTVLKQVERKNFPKKVAPLAKIKEDRGICEANAPNLPSSTLFGPILAQKVSEIEPFRAQFPISTQVLAAKWPKPAKFGPKFPNLTKHCLFWAHSVPKIDPLLGLVRGPKGVLKTDLCLNLWIWVHFVSPNSQTCPNTVYFGP